MTEPVQSKNYPDEKVEEKAEEKQHEKREEKSWDEKWSRDPLGAVIWALILIWAGVVFLASNLGLLQAMPLPARMGPWSWVLTGAGALLLIEVLARLVLPAYTRPVIGTLILGLVFLGLGLGDTYGWGLIWPILLIGFGLMILLRGLISRR